MANIVTREEAASLAAKMRTQAKRVGFTSGVFDLLHPGHVEYLEQARAECDFLIVGVNSDASVRRNKGALRPVCPEADRAQVVSALAPVDCAFVFDETNNNRNVELIKPDVYIKAGDYDRARLSSAAIVEKHGGRVVLVPFKPGHSSSAIIERVLDLGSEAVSEKLPAYEPKPAVFLDRDGTLNEHVEYLHEPEKFKLIPGVIEALGKFKQAGYRLVVVTNQPGIGLGYFSKEQFFEVNRELLRAVSGSGINLDRVYFCPHSRADECSCRKPRTAMIERAARELNLKLGESVVIGDMTSDVKMARDAGLKAVLVRTGRAGQDGLYQVQPDFEAQDLNSAAEWLLAQSAKGKS